MAVRLRGAGGGAHVAETLGGEAAVIPEVAVLLLIAEHGLNVSGGDVGHEQGADLGDDVLEEIVGEIRDEYDEDERTWEKVGKGEWIFEARTSIIDFCKVVNIDAETLGDKADNCESIGGLLLEIKQDFLHLNENVKYKGILFTVLSMDKRRIDRVKVKIKEM